MNFVYLCLKYPMPLFCLPTPAFPPLHTVSCVHSLHTHAHTHRISFRNLPESVSKVSLSSPQVQLSSALVEPDDYHEVSKQGIICGYKSLH